MTQHYSPIRIARIALIGIVAAALTASMSEAATRSMTGTMAVLSPSGGIEGGPGIYGRKVGGTGPNTFPPNQGAKTISVAGTSATTFTGRQITLGAGDLGFSGVVTRVFPAFSNVGQTTKTFMSLIGAATFAENGGALASCPGPGCTGAGAGTAISWCPPVSHDPLAPAPGTAGAPVGNWDCPSWPAGAGGGDRFIRIGISNSSGRPNFGGTLEIIRNFTSDVWRVRVQPSTPNASDAEATRSFKNLTAPWTGGLPNFQFETFPNNPGPRVFARLDGSGAIDETFGCTNGVGTPGGSFMRGSPIGGLGSNCGTNQVPLSPGQGWGFKMTTGTISGSDPYPFGLVVTTVGGTPFNPNFGTQPASQGFFFSRMGTDSVSGTNRNLVLLGGAVAVDPESGNSFFRISDLKMSLTVPEPTASLGLLAGVGIMVGLARRRRD